MSVTAISQDGSTAFEFGYGWLQQPILSAVLRKTNVSYLLGSSQLGWPMFQWIILFRLGKIWGLHPLFFEKDFFHFSLANSTRLKLFTA